MPLSSGFIISQNLRRLAPWRTCTEHLIHSSALSAQAPCSPCRPVPCYCGPSGLKGRVFIQRCPRWAEAAAGGACIPYQICCLSYTVWQAFTADGIIICNQSPLNAVHWTICPGNSKSFSSALCSPFSSSPFPFFSCPFFLSFHAVLLSNNEWFWHLR